MTISAAVLDALLAAGATAEMIAAAVKADIVENEARLEAGMARKRAGNAERQRRFREARNANNALQGVSNAMSRVTDEPIIKHARVRGDARADDSSSSSVGTEKKDNNNIRVSARSELETVLDPLHAGAVLEHRQRIRKPLTPHAAKLLAGKLVKAPDPNAAADEMILRGWQGFEPKWLQNGSGPGPPAKPPTASAKMVELLKKPLEEIYARNGSEEPSEPALRAIRDGRR